MERIAFLYKALFFVVDCTVKSECGFQVPTVRSILVQFSEQYLYHCPFYELVHYFLNTDKFINKIIIKFHSNTDDERSG